MCDSDRIFQVLNNLIRNSLNAILPKSGHIKIHVTEQKKVIKIMVEDDGKGISKDKIPTIFSKFHQLDMSQIREIGGIGLGLALGKKIIEVHGGKIWAESELGKGTSIVFTLPKVL